MQFPAANAGAIFQAAINRGKFQGIICPKNGMAAAVKYIKNNLDQPISIQKVADAAYMSKSSFYRYFKNEFGMTPVEYINKERIDYACSLLTQQDKNVTDVSYELGFSSLSHFIKLLKDETGTTPKQFQLTKLK